MRSILGFSFAAMSLPRGLFPIQRKHIGKTTLVLGLAATLGAALVAGSSPNVSHAQEPEPDKNSERCSIAQIERMVNEGIGQSDDCPGSWAQFPGAEADVPETQVGAEPQALAGSCPYSTEGDYPHLSGSDVSAHGWWETSNYALCPTYADVEVWLQGYWCDPWGCLWITVGHDERRIQPRNISGQRTTARAACVPSDTVGYRSIIDVDLVGVSDPSDQEYRYNNLNCSPS